MARTEYFIQDGLIVKQQSNSVDEKGLFNLSKWFKRLLNRFHVAFTDDCCDPSEGVPVRYNTTEDQLERYDPETDTWIAVS